MDKDLGGCVDSLLDRWTNIKVFTKENIRKIERKIKN